MPVDLLELRSQPNFSKKKIALFTTYISLVNSSTRTSSWDVGAQGRLITWRHTHRYCLKYSGLEEGWRTFSRACAQTADNFGGNYFQCGNPGLLVPYGPLIQWRHRDPWRLVRRAALRLPHPLFRPRLELNLNSCYIWSRSHSDPLTISSWSPLLLVFLQMLIRTRSRTCCMED